MRPSKSTARSPLLPNDAYTRTPSVAGVAEAWLFLGWRYSRVRSGGRNASQSILPSERRKQSTETRPSLYAVVRNTRSAQTIGDEWPRPGTGIFHSTFSVSDHRSG